MKNIPNIITMFRLIGAFSLLLFDVRSEGFCLEQKINTNINM